VERIINRLHSVSDKEFSGQVIAVSAHEVIICGLFSCHFLRKKLRSL
jgi:hypothetical protein